jgi:outer membrane protein TolC
MKYVFFLCFLFCYSSSRGQLHDLQFYLQQASDNSPLIKDYQNQVLSNTLDSQILRATLKPQVNILGSASYAPIIGGWGYDEAITNIHNLAALVQVNRNFVNRNNIGAQVRSIALQNRSLYDTIRLSEKDLARSVTEQYITAYGDQLTMDFNKEVFDLLQKEEGILKKLTQQSVFKQTDYLNFYVTMQQQELAWLQSEIQYNTDYLTLNYLAGIVDTTIQRVAAPSIEDTAALGFDQSIFVQKFTTDSLRIENAKTLLNFEYKPRLGAYADGGFNSTLNTPPVYKNVGFSAGLSLTIPIYDGHQRQMKYAKIELQEKTRQNNKQFFINQYNQQVALLKKQLYAIKALEDKINQQITYTNTLIVANGQLLQTGDITMKDYVLALNNYLNAKNLLTQNNVSKLKIINQINYWNK